MAPSSSSSADHSTENIAKKLQLIIKKNDQQTTALKKLLKALKKVESEQNSTENK